jgi:hypothetical protein
MYSLAGELLAHDAAHVGARPHVAQYARQQLAVRGAQRRLAPRRFAAVEADADEGKADLAAVANDVADQFPDQFHGPAGQDKVARLQAILDENADDKRPAKMSEDDTCNRALSLLQAPGTGVDAHGAGW